MPNIILDAEYAVVLLVIQIIGYTNAINVCIMPIWICATSRREPFMSIFLHPEKTLKIFKRPTTLIFFLSHFLMKLTVYQNTYFSRKLDLR
ncbi:unnamed protein product [Lactuca virosa]|uniref:Uncharacterized protein n=1 Tax=Lactuca virosa TaxID=75947 RepID=A0AAU9N3I0_9ASTR|nr:unnamed protein product [Lactuca virosa]